VSNPLNKTGTNFGFAQLAVHTNISPRDIIETYARRLQLEVAFHEAKGKLGFEHPQNRTTRAVERTAPMALLATIRRASWAE